MKLVEIHVEIHVNSPSGLKVPEAETRGVGVQDSRNVAKSHVRSRRVERQELQTSHKSINDQSVKNHH